MTTQQQEIYIQISNVAQDIDAVAFSIYMFDACEDPLSDLENSQSEYTRLMTKLATLHAELTAGKTFGEGK